ncbi:ribosomal protein subunit L31 [Schizosaccharomyces octosporus yFS286]|uniref:Large ribosomal subunit protein mL60 n=1 Tax=Schizosaccharomyces octosporus (strain yFS286) TaxID=483514 RepID=S9R0R2_SCHOY|nr:ribosomal protein subunit L31 [Schizosaccharomyces octosporus yFS286]EPX72040.1 ribosomal protein subunit L31 [Schizosaccharomyces octosporus yFS286]
MFGPFRSTFARFGGLVKKDPWRLSHNRKYRLRQRLRDVDQVVDVLRSALSKQNESVHAIENFVATNPRESEMTPKDKYTVFTRKTQGAGPGGFRKSIHKVPKWTKITHRTNPEGF